MAMLNNRRVLQKILSYLYKGLRIQCFNRPTSLLTGPLSFFMPTLRLLHETRQRRTAGGFWVTPSTFEGMRRQRRTGRRFSWRQPSKPSRCCLAAGCLSALQRKGPSALRYLINLWISNHSTWNRALVAPRKEIAKDVDFESSIPAVWGGPQWLCDVVSLLTVLPTESALFWTFTWAQWTC